MSNVLPLPVLSTRDYSRFSFYDANRPADHWPKLAESIQERDLTPYVPVMCAVDVSSGMLQIIDGQNRFKACKHLGLPIHYMIVPEGKEDDIQRLNQYQKNWLADDYLNFYAKKGLPAYVAVVAIISECKGFNASTVARIWQGGKRDYHTNAMTSFKNGTYTLPPEGQSKVRQVYALFSKIQHGFGSKGIVNKSSLIATLSSLYLHDLFSVNKMSLQIEKYGHMIYSAADKSQYRDMLEHVYNFKQRSKVSFKY
jgi:hypothetical protein